MTISNQNHTAKKVLISLTASVGLRYSEVALVPADFSDDEVQALANSRSRDVAADEFVIDESSFDQDSCKGSVDGVDGVPTILVTRNSGGCHVVTDLVPITSTVAQQDPSEVAELVLVQAGPDANTIIAALRYYQAQGQGEPFNRTDDIHDLATDGGEEVSLNDDGIDELIQRIQSAGDIKTFQAKVNKLLPE